MITETWMRAGRICLLAAVAGAVLSVAPTASAEPPGEKCPQQQDAPPGDAQEQQCEQGPEIPDLPDLPDNQSSKKPQEGDLADTNCWVVNGVPRWNAPGTAPMPAGPFDDVQWCPTFYGLTPHPTGT